MLPENYNSEYYNLTAPVELTGDNTSLGSAFIGEGVDKFQAALEKEVEKLDPSFRKLTLKVLTRVPGVGNLVAREVEVAFDPEKERYTVGEFVIDTAGTIAVGAVLTALAASVGVAGTSVLGVAAIGVGASLIWNGVKEAGDELLDIILGTVQTDIQILDTNNDVIGGAFIQEGLAEENELAAIEELLGQTIKNDLPFDNETLPPDIIAGENSIRIVRQNGFTDGENITYRVYDGELIDIISSEFDVTEEELLALGTENAPNTNEQISFLPTLLNAPSYIFAADENRFYVPLPDTNGGTNTIGIHPGNIYYGSDSSDVIDAFEDDNNRDPDLLSEEALMLGLAGNDTIKGNIGKDIIFGGSGNDNLDGSAGEDTAVFSDDFANYDYEIAEDGTITLTHARGTQTDGIDTLTNIELAQFKDQTLPLPLEETESELDDGSITFKFETTLDSELSTVKILDTDILGTNPNISLSYTFNSNAENKSPFPSLGLYELDSAQLSINNETAILNILEPDDGNISVITEYTPNQKAYKVEFSYTNDINPPSLFGQDISVVQITLIDDDFNLFDNTSLPTDPGFAENIDQQNILITFKNNAVLALQENTSIFEIEKTPFTLTLGDNNSVESVKPIVEDKPSELPQDEVTEDNNIISDTEATNSPLNGTDNDDRLEGTSSNDDIFSGSGDDTIIGGLGSDYISLETGSNLLIYNSSAESSIIEDGDGADLISGFTQGEDKIDLSALGFNSVTDLIATQYTSDEGNTISEVYSRSEDGFGISFEGAYDFTANDFIFDTADGSSQLDTLTGSESDDSPFYGSFGDDYIDAKAGDDDIHAGSGNDTIVSGTGDDYLELGAGNDVILISSITDSSNASGVDYVGDFIRGEDKIDISSLGLSDVNDFSVHKDGDYTEIYSNDFALGFDGDYTFDNSDFIFE
jgi:hypothetical protein